MNLTVTQKPILTGSHWGWARYRPGRKRFYVGRVRVPRFVFLRLWKRRMC